MSNIPAMSVVMATLNRCQILKVTLEKLASQSLSGDLEVLVVDDGSTDDTSEMLEEITCSLPYRLRYFRHENRGPGYSQNRGIKESESDIVLLMADDIWAGPELLSQHLKTHSEQTGDNFAVLGKVVQSPDLPKTVIHKYWDPFRYGRFDGKSELDGINFMACNISVKKSYLMKHGMYREAKGAAHEDIELGYRLREQGLRIIYNEDALAYHHHPETLTNACRRAYERGCNFIMLSDNMPKSFAFSLYNICTMRAGWRAFLRMLPREIPRKLVFNRWTVNVFWLPILERAETNRLAALFANQLTYRGTIYYHQRLGYRDHRMKSNSLQGSGISLSGTVKERQ